MTSSICNKDFVNLSDSSTTIEQLSSSFASNSDSTSSIPQTQNVVFKEKLQKTGLGKLNRFIQVYGNVFKNKMYFLAIRFISPVVILKSLGCSQEIIKPIENSIVVLASKINNSLLETESCLCFQVNGNTNNTNIISVSNSTEECLLRALLKDTKIISSIYVQKTLFVLSCSNPFRTFYYKCPRNESYRALVDLTDMSLDSKIHMTVQDVAKLRFFHRNNYNLKVFNAWYHFVQHIVRDKMSDRFKQPITSNIGSKVFKIIQRSSNHVLSDNHPSKDFYICEILFTTTVPLGVAYRVENGMLNYVSPMIVSEITQVYKDSNYIICNGWMPLYRDEAAWKTFGMEWYVTHLGFSLRYFPSILTYIAQQNNEKYRQMYIDLSKVYFIVYVEAFVRAGPLINKHVDLYNSSKSFLDFLFKLCQIQPLEHHLKCNDVRHEQSEISSNLDKVRIKQLERELNDCNTKMASSMKELENRNNQLERDKKSLKKERDELEQKLKDCKIKITSINELEYKNEQLAQDNKVLQKERDKLNQELWDCKTKITSRKELEYQDGQHAQYEKSLEKERDELKTELKDCKTKITELETLKAELASKQDVNFKVLSKSKELEESLQKEKDYCQEQVKMIENMRAKYENTLDLERYKFKNELDDLEKKNLEMKKILNDAAKLKLQEYLMSLMANFIHYLKTEFNIQNEFTIPKLYEEFKLDSKVNFEWNMEKCIGILDETVFNSMDMKYYIELFMKNFVEFLKKKLNDSHFEYSEIWFTNIMCKTPLSITYDNVEQEKKYIKSKIQILEDKLKLTTKNNESITVEKERMEHAIINAAKEKLKQYVMLIMGNFIYHIQTKFNISEVSDISELYNEFKATIKIPDLDQNKSLNILAAQKLPMDMKEYIETFLKGFVKFLENKYNTSYCNYYESWRQESIEYKNLNQPIENITDPTMDLLKLSHHRVGGIFTQDNNSNLPEIMDTEAPQLNQKILEKWDFLKTFAVSQFPSLNNEENWEIIFTTHITSEIERLNTEIQIAKSQLEKLGEYLGLINIPFDNFAYFIKSKFIEMNNIPLKEWNELSRILDTTSPKEIAFLVQRLQDYKDNGVRIEEINEKPDKPLLQIEYNNSPSNRQEKFNLKHFKTACELLGISEESNWPIFNATIMSVMRNLRQKTEKCEFLQEENNKLSGQLKELKDKIQKDSQLLIENKQVFNNELHSKSTEIHGLKNEIVRLEHDLEMKVKEINYHLVVIKENNAEIENLKTQIEFYKKISEDGNDQLNSKFQLEQTETKRLRGTINNLNTEIEILNSQLNSEKSTNKDLINNIQRLTQTSEQLKIQLISKENQSQNSDYIKSLQEEIEKHKSYYEDEIHKLNTQIIHLQEEIKNWQTRIKKIRNEKITKTIENKYKNLRKATFKSKKLNKNLTTNEQLQSTNLNGENMQCSSETNEEFQSTNLIGENVQCSSETNEQLQSTNLTVDEQCTVEMLKNLQPIDSSEKIQDKHKRTKRFQPTNSSKKMNHNSDDEDSDKPDSKFPRVKQIYDSIKDCEQQLEQKKMNIQMLKSLFMNFYNRYFKLLWEYENEMIKSDEILKAEIKQKISILADLYPGIRNNTLLEILLIYVNKDLNIRNETIYQDLSTDEDVDSNIPLFLDNCLKKSVEEMKKLKRKRKVESERLIKPANDAVNKPANDAVNKPANDAVNKPANDAVNKPANDAVNKPANDAGNKPANDAVNKPVNVLADEPANVLADEPANVLADEPIDVRERENPSKVIKTEANQDVSTKRSEFYPRQDYAILNDGNEIYAKNSMGGEFPLTQNGVSVYIKVKKMVKGEEHLIEVPPKGVNGADSYIHNEDGIVYPWNFTTNRPIFKIDKEGCEEYLTDSLVTEAHYPIDSVGNVYYAQDNNGDEYAIKFFDKFIYAKGKDNKEIYPKSANGDEFALTDNGVSYYAKDADDVSGSEIYCRKLNRDECYLPTDNPERIYARNEKNEKRYARGNNGREIYAEIKEEPIVIRNKEDNPIYAKNELKSEYYPMKNGKDIVFRGKEHMVIYACDQKGQEFYPKDERGNEYSVDNIFIGNEDGTKVIHPRDVNGKSMIYPYQLYDGTYPFERDSDGDEIYPVDINGNQYYPGDVAHTKDNLPLYAYSKDGEIIYETNSNGDEIYLSNPDDLTDVILVKNGNQLPRYAITHDGEEIYPKYTISIRPFRQIEMILNNQYAKDSVGRPKYPLDFNGNEYTLHPISNDIDKVFPIGYPITNDEKIIIPNINDEPYFIKETDSMVTVNNIDGIIRENWPVGNKDYVTNIKSTRKSRALRQYPYEIKWTRSVEKKSITKANPPVNTSSTSKSGYGGFWKLVLGLLVGLVIVIVIFMNFSLGKTLPFEQEKHKSTTIISQPTSTAPKILSTRTFHHRFQKNGNILELNVDSVGKWTMEIPKSFTFQTKRIVPQDVCHNQPDGARILAGGRLLYDYMRRNLFQHKPIHKSFESNSGRVLQYGESFYFICKSGSILRLHQCPPGKVFRDGQCSKIDACTGKPENFLLPDPYDETAFYECRGAGLTSIHRKCPDNHWFIFDACRSKNDDAYYCQFYDKPRRIDDTTFVICRDKKPKYYSCPPGTRIFDKFECESDECVGQKNGTKLAMKLERNGPFKYAPGYNVCENDKVIRKVFCDKTWDLYYSKEENLTHIPMVFDGNDCAVPELCENVQYDDKDIIVPAYEFSRRVKNWKWSNYYDRLSGFYCPHPQFKTAKKRVNIQPGQIINPKRFKVESACAPGVTRIPIATDDWNLFYKCDDEQNIYKCQPDHTFDDTLCRRSIKHAHKFKNYPMFRFDSISTDGWILPFNYGDQTQKVSCSAPETEFNSVYNICHHPDCASFPFLSQMKTFSIKLKNERSECTFDSDTRRIKKRDVEHRYTFWSQRLVPENISNVDDTCVPGNKIESGNFVLDATLYATCDESQPFVFCPSSHTRGIVRVNDSLFACSPPFEAIVDARQPIRFEPNEIAEIRSANSDSTTPDPTIVRINREPATNIPEGKGIKIKENEHIELSTTGPVKIVYRYRVSHPPNVAFNDNTPIQSRTSQSAFLLKRKDFTTKIINFPSYEIGESVSNFVGK
ncbi:Capsid-associated protein Vp91 like protein [Argiope bruennichi]|uniref:Capsid-associated protein Vp91 like protein n=1 Tax=Argiope bruennichi TaxID=94029 RepID=A0A8T0EZB7_ARGBR|nr:Capsid-associated protein Vp91 like protein [Argiope bruennichi]